MEDMPMEEMQEGGADIYSILENHTDSLPEDTKEFLFENLDDVHIKMMGIYTGPEGVRYFEDLKTLAQGGMAPTQSPASPQASSPLLRENVNPVQGGII